MNLKIERLNGNGLKITWEDKKLLQPRKLSWKVVTDKRFKTLKWSKEELDHIIFENPSPDTRNIYRILFETGEVIEIAHRDINPNGEDNFRDIGGYQTIDGQRVKWGMVYRSAILTDLSPSNLNYINKIGIKTVCDLRTISEVESQSQIVLAGARYINLPLVDSNYFDYDTLNDIDRVRDFSRNSYIEFAFSKNMTKLFQLYYNTETYPLLIHCAGGKDRTGVAIALLLTALGVPRQTVIEDYMLSEKMMDVFMKKIYEKYKNMQYLSYKKENIQAQMYPQKEYLNAVFDEIDRKFDSIERYFDEYGLSQVKRERLKKRLLV